MSISGKNIFWSLFVVAAYFVAGTLGLKLAYVHQSATAVWLPTGVAFAALMWCGCRAWPLIMVGAFLVNLVNSGSVPASIGIAAGNTLEALVAAILIRRFSGGLEAFDSPKRIFLFVVVVAVACTVGASGGLATVMAFGLGDVSRPSMIWLTWWLGDAIGAIIGGPLIILWLRQWRLEWKDCDCIEAMLLIVSAVMVGLVVFESRFGGANAHYPLEFICPPIVLWAALRFGRRETVLVNFVMLGIALHGSVHGSGPFARADPNESLLLLQCYMAATSIISLVVAAVVDERKRLQAELVQRAKDLDRSNKELEQYAYVASHDLQEPLRMIASYSHLLNRRYRGKLDAKADEFLSYIELNVHRMEEFIKGLLEYSRVTNSEGTNQIVQLNDVLQDAQGNLANAIQKAQAVITHDPMPTVRCNRLEIRQVLQNLLANALKFRGKDSPAIHVAIRKMEREWIVSVKDNGIGIEQQYAGRLFEMFYRIHSASEYPGAGIGLAVCKKVVERHGGRIWFESVPGQGATFYFSLPTKSLETGS
jgi:signal transduction histidine kinase